MALTPKQQAWCEEWNISPRLVDAISEALRNEASPIGIANSETSITKVDACPKCNMYSCRCSLDEFPFGLESAQIPPVAPNLKERWEDVEVGQPEITPITQPLSHDAEKERNLRDKAEDLVMKDIKTRVNKKKDEVKMHPSTDAPN